MCDLLEQIEPIRIHRFDQRQLLGPGPSLDLLFAEDRRFHCLMHFVPDEQLAVIAPREAISDTFTVLPLNRTGIVGGSNS